jgi:hypothetical protein
MSELLASIRADLTDRRLLPVVALVAACLVAALAYALLGGSSGSATPGSGAASNVTPPPAGISVTGASTERAVAETPDGAKEQTGGSARNPFTLLSLPPSAKAASTAASSPASSSSSAPSSSSSSTTTSSGSSGGAGGSSGATGESSKPKSKKKSHKPQKIYNVAIEFGTLPPGTTPETAQLTPFENLKLESPLPSAQEPLLVFRGVTAKGASATFTLVGEAILSGTGACLPSATQCEAVDLKPGETEQLSYLAADGQTTVYELRVLSITPEQPSAKSARAHGWALSKAGRELLARAGLQALPFLRYSTQPGVLVFAPRKASAARAHTAVVTATPGF